MRNQKKTVDANALAKFFGVDIDPGRDPAGFISALVGALDEAKAHLTGQEMETVAANFRYAANFRHGGNFEDDDTDMAPPVTNWEAIINEQRRANRRPPF